MHRYYDIKMSENVRSHKKDRKIYFTISSHFQNYLAHRNKPTSCSEYTFLQATREKKVYRGYFFYVTVFSSPQTLLWELAHSNHHPELFPRAIYPAWLFPLTRSRSRVFGLLDHALQILQLHDFDEIKQNIPLYIFEWNIQEEQCMICKRFFLSCSFFLYFP